MERLERSVEEYIETLMAMNVDDNPVLEAEQAELGQILVDWDRERRETTAVFQVRLTYTSKLQSFLKFQLWAYEGKSEYRGIVKIWSQRNFFCW